MKLKLSLLFSQILLEISVALSMKLSPSSSNFAVLCDLNYPPLSPVTVIYCYLLLLLPPVTIVILLQPKPQLQVSFMAQSDLLFSAVS